MPHTVDSPYVICLAKTEVLEENVREWLARLQVDEAHQDWLLGVEEDCIPTAYGAVSCRKLKSDGAILTELAGRRCYMSLQENLNPNVKRIRRDFEDYLDNILDSGHGSVLEHTFFTFAIENVSRVLTGELNRHRVGSAISEGSMRFIRFDDIPFWMPKLFQHDLTLMPPWPPMLPPWPPMLVGDSSMGECHSEPPEYCRFAGKEQASRFELRAAFGDMERHYRNLCEIWKEELNATGKTVMFQGQELSPFDVKKQLTSAFRRIIGMGVATGGIWSFNIRALRHIITMRTTKHAEEEIALVGAALLRTMMNLEPQLFGDFKFDELGFAAPRYLKV